jgi:hypothetical protein
MPIPLILSDNVLLDARLTGEGIRKQLPEGFSEIYSMRSATWSGGWVSKNNSFCPMQGQGVRAPLRHDREQYFAL